MNVAIVGCGAVGLYYGAQLSKAGAKVFFLMRSGLEEARTRGIHIQSPGGDFHLEQPLVSGQSGEIGTVDFVIVATKATSNSTLPDLVRPLLGEGTSILTLQNGLGHEEELAAEFPGHPIAGGLCFVCLNRVSSASVRHIGHGSMTIGQHANSMTPETRALAEFWISRKIQIDLAPDLAEARWRKLIWNVPFNGLTITAGGVGVDAILADPALFAECNELMEEIRRIAWKEGVGIEAEYLNWQIERTYPMGAYFPSSLIDFLNGKEVEIDAIWGRALDRARRMGVSTPALERLHSKLSQLCMRDNG